MASASVSCTAVLVFQLFTNFASFLTANCGGGANTGDDIVKLVLAAVDTSIGLGAILAGLMKPDLEVRGLGATTAGASTGAAGLLVVGTVCFAVGLPVEGAGLTFAGGVAEGLTEALAGALAGVLAETEIGAFVGVGVLALAALAVITDFFAAGLALALLAALTGGLDLAVLATVCSIFFTVLATGFAAGLAALLGAFLVMGFAAALLAGLETDLAGAFGAGLAAGLLGLAAVFCTGLPAVFLAGAALALTIGFFTVVDFLTVVFTVLSPRRLSRAFMAASPASGFSDFLTVWNYSCEQLSARIVAT
jgi:hypothetical protein